jgi:GT2 family glycosyltransferase
MKMRQAGWRVIYQPHAWGIHEGSTTTSRSIDFNATVRESCRIFGNKWGWYFEKNAHNTFGSFT